MNEKISCYSNLFEYETNTKQIQLFSNIESYFLILYVYFKQITNIVFKNRNYTNYENKILNFI